VVHRVAIVVDPAFGNALDALANRLHVWVCSSPANRRAAEEHSTWGRPPSAECGITTFKVESGESPEAMLLAILPDVDLHHGRLSHPSGWEAIEVYGMVPTDATRAALREYGVNRFAITEWGFECAREPSGAA
jgi:hypothetical protein